MRACLPHIYLGAWALSAHFAQAACPSVHMTIHSACMTAGCLSDSIGSAGRPLLAGWRLCVGDQGNLCGCNTNTQSGG